MSRAIFYIGPSGSGKTTAARTLNPKSTFVFNALGKDLPWKGSAKQYKYWSKENTTGNMLKTSNPHTVLTWLDHIDKKLPHVTDIVIDDNTFITSLELLRRQKETSWDKFTDIAQNFIAIAEKCKTMRDDLIVHILHHTQVEGDGILDDKTYRAMSYGKLIDEKLGTQEAQFTIVLRAAKLKKDTGIEYVFYTSDPDSTAKAPMGMFEQETIPNDMDAVSKIVRCYYDEEGCEEIK